MADELQYWFSLLYDYNGDGPFVSSLGFLVENLGCQDIADDGSIQDPLCLDDIVNTLGVEDKINRDVVIDGLIGVLDLVLPWEM